MDEKEFQELLAYQNMLSRQVVQEARTDKKIKLMQLINNLTGDGRKRVQTAALVHEAESQGFNEQEAYDLLDELAGDHIVEEKAGYVVKL